MFVKLYSIKLIFLFFFSAQLFAQDIHIKNRVEDITIKNDSSFINDVVILGQLKKGEALPEGKGLMHIQTPIINPNTNHFLFLPSS